MGDWLEHIPLDLKQITEKKSKHTIAFDSQLKIALTKENQVILMFLWT